MDVIKQEVLDEWLKIDLTRTAFKMKFINRFIEPSEELIYKTIRCLDNESYVEQKPSINYIVTLIGLMWEHINHEEFDVRKVIIKFLSRIGYPTSAIICDVNYDKENGSFSMLDSWIDEVSSTMYQLENEISVANQKYLLTSFQKQIWDSMSKDRLLGISAPTSAGKSFVILLKLCDRLRVENFDVVYIVPTLSLLTQVTEDFKRELDKARVENYWISNSFESGGSSELKNIYVMTQEKAINAFSETDNAFSKKLVLVADEIQNIERIKEDSDERARILFDTLTEFRYKENVDQIIISGPRIEKIDLVGKDIFGLDTRNHTTDTSPVLNITYSIKKIDNRYFLNQYCACTESPRSLEIENTSLIEGYGQNLYSDKYMSYLSKLVNTVGEEGQNIIFAPTSSTARKIAIAIEGNGKSSSEELIDYYSNTIRKNYSLCKTLQKGVAYHHGKLPQHVRRTLEKAIADGKIRDVVCTTTLLQGVNFPAQNVFIRNPHLYIRKKTNSAELTNYEMANLRGRAGRLLKDYIGRAFVLDENGFLDTDGYEQLDLFDDVTKELPTSYSQKYEEFQEPIEKALDKNVAVDSTMQKYGYIVSYIRQSVLKYGDKARARLSDVGIRLTLKQVNEISTRLKELSVPKDICYKNRYWDPVVLDVIYKSFNGEMPATPVERGAISKLDNALRFLRDNSETNNMYTRYIPAQYQNGKIRRQMVKLGLDWSKGIPLNALLDSDWYDGDDGEEHIDNTIELIQKTISFKLPLLLKPLFDIKKPDNNILTCIQLGAFSPTARTMIEMGIPRETSLYLFDYIFNGNDPEIANDMDVEQVIRKRISEKYSDLPYWIGVQVEFLI